MQNALNPSWWHQPPAMQPLDAIRLTAECLEQGTVVPVAAAAIVARALRQYLAGEQADISISLGLRTRRGGAHETPLRLEQSALRNQSIRSIFAAMPGDTKKERAEQTAELLRRAPDPQITEADVFANLMQLYAQHAGTLPTSARQVTRIINGDTVADRKK